MIKVNTTEETILKALVKNKEFFINVVDLLEDNDFKEAYPSKVFPVIKQFYKEHGRMNISDITISLQAKYSQEITQWFVDVINTNTEYDKYIQEYAFDKTKKSPIMELTETYVVQTRVEEKVLVKAVEIIDGQLDGARKKELLTQLINEFKESVSFELTGSVSHDYKKDYTERFAKYAEAEAEMIEAPLRIYNLAKAGRKGTLTVNLAISNAGKTLHKANWAAYSLQQGKNVGYITLEDGDIEISQRVDQNIMSVSLREITDKHRNAMLKEQFELTVGGLPGRLMVKDFSSATPSKIRTLLDQWLIKDNFKPDILFIDYLGLMSDDQGSSHNSFDKYKNIAEDVRAIAKDYDIAIVTSVQANRSAFSMADATEMGMEVISESIAIAQTADTIIGIFPQKRASSNDSSVDWDESDIEKAETTHVMLILKSRKVNKDAVKPFNVKVLNAFQQAFDKEMTKTYVGNETKKAIADVSALVEEASKDEFDIQTMMKKKLEF